MNRNKKILFTGVFTVVIVLAGSFIVLTGGQKNFLKGKSFTIENFNVNKETNDNPENNTEENVNSENEKEKNPINGIACDNAIKRPLAVMMAGDLEAWPLSGISEADLVVEMPVVTNGITRYMAVFVCGNPKEIGSIRSARHDFIPLAMGFDAIFAHWGGSHFALEKLDNKIMDNINALYRRSALFGGSTGRAAFGITNRTLCLVFLGAF